MIKSIEKIAREKQRDVLCLSFIDSLMVVDKLFKQDFEQHKLFADVTAWLDANGIEWQPCSIFPDEVTSGYIYFDVPFDENDPVYQKLADHLQNLDGSMKVEGVNLYCLRVEDAMKNAHEDEPLEPGVFEKYWQV